MCDSKYCDIQTASDFIKEWLLENGWSKSMSDSLIDIITTMSYSKLKKSNPDYRNGNVAYPNHGIWQRAYQITRHADLLEGYRTVRCYLYSKRRMPNSDEAVIWAETEKIIKERVLNYVKDGWIFLDAALKYIPSLEKETLRCLEEKDTNYVL
jgi:hypothetical protein